MKLNFQETINQKKNLSTTDWKPAIQTALFESGKTIIVLDDDPTGTQTVYDVPVLTTWDEKALTAELENGSQLFYILTNSRSLNSEEADALNIEIGGNIRKIFDEKQQDFIIVSRSDSTLRGHFPNEVTALSKALNFSDYITAVIPAFFEGGRFTIDDVHYVKEGDELIPAAETAFAADKAFGFENSNLKAWVEEKTKGETKAEKVYSFSLEALRDNTVDEIADELNAMENGTTLIVNALEYADLEKFALSYLKSGKQVVFRTAASYVKALAGMASKELLTKEELTNAQVQNGGLIVVGSYVPKTSRQLANLLKNSGLDNVEIDVNQVLSEKLSPSEVVKNIEESLKNGQSVVVYTSRKLQTGTDEKESLKIGNKIADFITATVQNLSVVPKFIVAKGGITSSDIATKALKIRRANVAGQALPGVPVWTAGEESKFPQMPYIIFPGNVGDDDSLALLYEKLTHS